MLKSVFAVAILLLASAGAMPQQKSGSTRIPLLENEEVRVWRSIIVPNAPLAMHRHDHPRLIIPLKGGDMKSVQQTGESETSHWEEGKAYWLTSMKPGTMHADVNAGGAPMEVVVVELKKAQ
jgi:quercetin dioxygenase-like cupin family protein